MRLVPLACLYPSFLLPWKYLDCQNLEVDTRLSLACVMHSSQVTFGGLTQSISYPSVDISRHTERHHARAHMIIHKLHKKIFIGFSLNGLTRTLAWILRQIVLRGHVVDFRKLQTRQIKKFHRFRALPLGCLGSWGRTCFS